MVGATRPLTLRVWGTRDVNEFNEPRRVNRRGIKIMGQLARWENFPHLATPQEARRIIYRVWTMFRIKLRHMINVVARRTGNAPPRLLITHQTENGASVGPRELRRRRVANILKRGY